MLFATAYIVAALAFTGVTYIRCIVWLYQGVIGYPILLGVMAVTLGLFIVPPRDVFQENIDIAVDRRAVALHSLGIAAGALGFLHAYRKSSTAVSASTACGNTVARRAGALFGGLRRLQIGAEVAGAFDDFSVLRQALRFEAAQRGLDVLGIERLRERRRIVGRLGNAGGDMGPRDEGRIADDRDPAEGEPRAFQIVDRLQDRLVDAGATMARNCGANSRSAAARMAAIGSARMSGGGIEIEWVTPAVSVSSAGSSVASSAGRYHTTL